MIDFITCVFSATSSESSLSSSFIRSFQELCVPILYNDQSSFTMKKKPITLKFNSVFVKQKRQRIHKDTKKQLNNPSWEATREWHARADAFSRGSTLEMESLLEGNHSMIFQSLVF